VGPGGPGRYISAEERERTLAEVEAAASEVPVDARGYGAGSPDGAVSVVPSATGVPKFGVPSAFQVNF
jgi:hypothetical protein